MEAPPPIPKGFKMQYGELIRASGKVVYRTKHYDLMLDAIADLNKVIIQHNFKIKALPQVRNNDEGLPEIQYVKDYK